MLIMKEEKKGAYAERTNEVGIEIRKQVSESLKNYHNSVKDSNTMIEKNIKNQGRIVLQYSKDNEYITKFRSIGEASRISGYSKSRLCHILHARINQSGEYIWMFEDQSYAT